jgi:hypothetical protein
MFGNYDREEKKLAQLLTWSAEVVYLALSKGFPED